MANLALALLGWLILQSLLKDEQKAAYIVSVAITIFFSYQLIPMLLSVTTYNWNKKTAFSINGFFETWAANLLLILSLSALGYALVSSLSRLRHKVDTNLFMNIAGGVLVLSTLLSLPQKNIPTTQLIDVPNDRALAWLADLEQQAQPLSPSMPNLPDIYLIVLDGYVRADILYSLYQVDNNQFLGHLADRGFYIATKSHSNYGSTLFSLASLLNYSYLDTLDASLPDGTNDLNLFKALISENQAFKQLRGLGYRLVVNSSGYELASFSNADEYLQETVVLHDFHHILLSNTPLSVFSRRNYNIQREQISKALTHLPDIANDPAPTLAFIHILAPHPPFVFDANGKPINPPRDYSIRDGSDFLMVDDSRDYINGYRGEIIYLNRRVQDAIDRILDNSAQPPIIILQGDHGSGLFFDRNSLENTHVWERYAILNAYYFPNHGDAGLYPTITPVNSLRVMFNTYFGTHYPLLPDRSFFVPSDSGYQHIEITRQLGVPAHE